MPTLLSIQIGAVREYGTPDAADPMDRAWTTAFFKNPLAGPVEIGPLGVAGDGTADRANHGGVDKAVLAYSADHYPHWPGEVAELTGAGYGAFGENLSIAGSTEETVCIGDAWRIGDVVLQVTQPRQPCWKMARRWRVADLPARVVANGRCGWYLRVLAAGVVEAEADVELRARPHPEWPVARAHQTMHRDKRDRAAAAELAALPELSDAWRTSLLKRAAGE